MGFHHTGYTFVNISTSHKTWDPKSNNVPIHVVIEMYMIHIFDAFIKAV